MSMLAIGTLWACAVLIISQAGRSRADDVDIGDGQFSGAPCKRGEWIGGACYDVHPVGASYNAARGACLGQGGRLPVVSDQATTARLIALLRRHDVPNSYIGLDDQFNEGQYVWSDGTGLGSRDFSVWAERGQGRPGWEQVSDCVELDAQLGTWTAINCNDQRPYICEFGDFTPGRTLRVVSKRVTVQEIA